MKAGNRVVPIIVFQIAVAYAILKDFGRACGSYSPNIKKGGVEASFRKSGVARLAGLEPATYGLEVRCSIQLSYRRLNSGHP